MVMYLTIEIIRKAVENQRSKKASNKAGKKRQSNAEQCDVKSKA